jgi:hypothetical protein
MNDTDLYDKTPLGAQEVRDRAKKLSPRMHSMLILTNGVYPLGKLKQDAKMFGAPEDFIAQLLALELITLIPSEVGQATSPRTAKGEVDEFTRYRAAKDFMNITAVDALGFKSFFFTLKLEKTGTRDELMTLLPDYTKAMEKKYGPDFAQQLCERARGLLT